MGPKKAFHINVIQYKSIGYLGPTPLAQHIIENAGHMMALEKPVEFMAGVEAFFKCQFLKKGELTRCAGGTGRTAFFMIILTFSQSLDNCVK